MLSTTAIAGIGLVLFLVLIFLGVPIYICMGGVGLLGCLAITHNFGAVSTFLSDAFIKTFTTYTVSVAPMFMLMGEIASESGIGSNLFKSVKTVLGRQKGALASAVQVACALFGAICGAAVATCTLMSRVACPEMTKARYSDELNTGAVSAGSVLATLIPPSLPLITYGSSVQESIGKLFFGGIFVGITLMVIFIIVVQIWCLIKPEAGPAGEKSTAKEKIKALKEGNVIEVVLVFGFSMLGMFTGWFTPTEAGAVGTILMLIVVIVNKRFSFKMLGRALMHTMMTAGMMYCLLAGTNIFGKFFTLARLSNTIGTFVAGLDVSKYAIIAVITLIFMILGCFMDAMAAVLVTAPILLPILQSFGYNAVWYGVYAVMITGLGAITPPVGMACFISSGITKVPVDRVFKGSAPFILAYLLMAALMAVFPQLAMWLPNLVMGG